MFGLGGLEYRGSLDLDRQDGLVILLLGPDPAHRCARPHLRQICQHLRVSPAVAHHLATLLHVDVRAFLAALAALACAKKSAHRQPRQLRRHGCWAIESRIDMM